ncbi:MAG: cation:proton antiporter [Pseudomonadales bacterium]|nr:cation:proton antiporter [Pseudomonadales bacterium]
MSEELFQQYITILSLSLVGVLLLRRLNMATIVAYIVVGAAIGPSGFALIASPEQFSFIAEFGVVFLLFALGLEFSLKKMLTMRFAVFGVGSFQVVVCTAVFFSVVYFWGTSFAAAIIIAGSLALSSTAIVTRELSNNRQLHSLHGQLSIGVLLLQDLVAVLFLIIVPVLGTESSGGLAPALVTAVINSALLIAILLAVGLWILPPIYSEVSKSNSSEIFVLTTLVIVLLAAWLTHAFHLSMTLGAFVIGMMLGEGPTKYQIENDIRPFKDILLGLFFVTIGMNLDIGLLVVYWPRILLFTVGLILVKGVAVAAVVRFLGYSWRDSATVGFDLAQAGEFGLALMALAIANQVVPPDQASIVILIAIFSMMVSPFLIRHAATLARKLFPADSASTKKLPINLHLENHVIIGGYGRLGSMLADTLDSNGIGYVAIERDIEIVEKYRKRGKNIVYGDSNNVEILNLCHLSTAKLVVLTFKSIEEGKAAITRIRQKNAKVPMIVRCQNHTHYDELISLGANHVFPELLESSLMIMRNVLMILEFSEDQIDAQISDYLQSLPADIKR